MNTYMLYGTKMIENDATLKDFASCIYNNIPMEIETDDPEERKDYILEMAEEILKEDISRTDIDYEGLLYKYRGELGDLFYRMWDRGYAIPAMNFLERVQNSSLMILFIILLLYIMKSLQKEKI